MGRMRGIGVGAAVGIVLPLLVGCSAPGAGLESGPRPERVSIAYGTRDASEVTGAVGSVSRSTLDASKGMRLVEILETRVSGVRVVRRPDGELSVRIRGARPGIGGEPLIVVDGIPIRSNQLMSVLSSMNPAAVKRIDVLKDAGETAAYGVQGGNGVIVITTLRGR